MYAASQVNTGIRNCNRARKHRIVAKENSNTFIVAKELSKITMVMNKDEKGISGTSNNRSILGNICNLQPPCANNGKIKIPKVNTQSYASHNSFKSQTSINTKPQHGITIFEDAMDTSSSLPTKSPQLIPFTTNHSKVVTSKDIEPTMCNTMTAATYQNNDKQNGNVHLNEALLNDVHKLNESGDIGKVECLDESTCTEGEGVEDMQLETEEKIDEPSEDINNDLPIKWDGIKVPDNLALTEYREDIYSYLLEAEVRFMPRSDYMSKQLDISHSMRTILVDWLVEVADEYKLLSETLFLTVSYIDRFLSLVSVVRGKLQLLGAAAMFHAAKFEEIYPPGVSEFVYITDDTYSVKQVLLMEQALFKVLQYNAASPTMHLFASDLLTQLSADEKLAHFTMYLLELSLLDGEHFLQYKPSVVATSALYLATTVLKTTSHVTLESVEKMSGYKISDLTDCCSALQVAASVADKAQQLAVFNKYNQAKKFFVAKLALSIPPVVSSL